MANIQTYLFPFTLFSIIGCGTVVIKQTSQRSVDETSVSTKVKPKTQTAETTSIQPKKTEIKSEETLGAVEYKTDGKSKVLVKSITNQSINPNSFQISNIPDSFGEKLVSELLDEESVALGQAVEFKANTESTNTSSLVLFLPLPDRTLNLLATSSKFYIGFESDTTDSKVQIRLSEATRFTKDLKYAIIESPENGSYQVIELKKEINLEKPLSRELDASESIRIKAEEAEEYTREAIQTLEDDKTQSIEQEPINEKIDESNDTPESLATDNTKTTEIIDSKEQSDLDANKNTNTLVESNDDQNSSTSLDVIDPVQLEPIAQQDLLNTYFDTSVESPNHISWIVSGFDLGTYKRDVNLLNFEWGSKLEGDQLFLRSSKFIGEPMPSYHQVRYKLEISSKITIPNFATILDQVEGMAPHTGGSWVFLYLVDETDSIYRCGYQGSNGAKYYFVSCTNPSGQTVTLFPGITTKKFKEIGFKLAGAKFLTTEFAAAELKITIHP